MHFASIGVLCSLILGSASAPAQSTISTCKTVRAVFSSGVARSSSSNVGLPLLSKPLISNTLYRKYRHLDVDQDGIACEIPRQLTSIERLESVVHLFNIEKSYYEEAQIRAAAQRKVNQLPLTIQIDTILGHTADAQRHQAELEVARRQVYLSTSKMTEWDQEISALPTYPSFLTFPRTGYRTNGSCSVLRSRFPNGVATSGFYSTNLLQKGYPKISNSTYEKYRALDLDEDGIACEVHRSMSTAEKLHKRLALVNVEEARIYSTVKIIDLRDSLVTMRNEYQDRTYYGDTGDSMDELREEIRYSERWHNRQTWIMSEFDHLVQELPSR